MLRTLALVLGLLGCHEPVTYATPLPVDDPFVRTPAVGEEAERFADAAAYSEKHNGRALLVLRGNEVVFETGQNGHALDEPHHLFSGTKSFTCALFGVLEGDGILTADEPIQATLPEVPDTHAAATVDQVLHLTSGAGQDFRSISRDGILGLDRVEDKYAHVLGLPWTDLPGERFEYGASEFNVFGELVTRKTGRSPSALLQERVFDPIGLKTAGWLHDPSGNPALAHGVWTTASEWAKYGALARDDGMFQGERIVPEGSMHDCFTGSVANPAYGRSWWLNQEVDDDVDLVGRNRMDPDGRIFWNEGPADLVAAAGHDDQRLYVIPSEDLVIVRLADGGWGFKDRELLRRLLGDR